MRYRWGFKQDRVNLRPRPFQEIKATVKGLLVTSSDTGSSCSWWCSWPSGGACGTWPGGWRTDRRTCVVGSMTRPQPKGVTPSNLPSNKPLIGPASNLPPIARLRTQIAEEAAQERDRPAFCTAHSSGLSMRKSGECLSATASSGALGPSDDGAGRGWLAGPIPGDPDGAGVADLGGGADGRGVAPRTGRLRDRGRHAGGAVADVIGELKGHYLSFNERRIV